MWDLKMLSDCSIAMILAFLLKMAHIFGLIPARARMSSFFGCQKPREPIISGLIMPKDWYLTTFLWYASSMFFLESYGMVTSTMTQELAKVSSMSGLLE